jgi:hypothetical protein
MTTANSVPLDALDLDKDEAVIHAKKTPSYLRWPETHDGDFFTYVHRSYKKGDQSLEEKLIASIIQLNAQSRKQAALKKVQQAELKKRLHKTVSLGDDTPEMVSAKKSKTYQLYLNAKDGDAIEFGQKSL